MTFLEKTIKQMGREYRVELNRVAKELKDCTHLCVNVNWDNEGHSIPVWLIICVFFKIHRKDGALVPFIFNDDQVEMYKEIDRHAENGEPQWYDILKARQLGFSTLIAGIIACLTMFQPNKRALIMAHKIATAEELYKMYTTFYRCLPEPMKRNMIPIDSNNARGMTFDFGEGNESSIEIVTNDKDAARGYTVQYVHLSECAMYKDFTKTMASVLSAIDKTYAKNFIFLETTANGFNEYKVWWDKDYLGGTTFKAMFFGCFSNKAYRLSYDGHQLKPYEKDLIAEHGIDLDQVQWYAVTLDQCNNSFELMHQEYPCTPFEAFVGTGNAVYPMETLRVARTEAEGRKPVMKGNFVYRAVFSEAGDISLLDIRFEESDRGNIEIWQLPDEDTPYFLNFDPAQGGADSFAAAVYDNTNRHMVATYNQSKIHTDEAGYQIICLYFMYAGGKRVNWKGETRYKSEYGMLSGERQPDSQILEMARKCGVRSIYQDFTDPDAISKGYQDKFGYRVTAANRKRMIDLSVQHFRDDYRRIPDPATLSEMETFQYIQKGDDPSNVKAMALYGAHDDRVMCDCGYCYCASALTSLKRSESSGAKRPADYEPMKASDIFKREGGLVREVYQEW